MRVLFSLCVCACVYLLFHQKPMTSSTFIVRPLFFACLYLKYHILFLSCIHTHTHRHPVTFVLLWRLFIWISCFGWEFLCILYVSSIWVLKKSLLVCHCPAVTQQFYILYIYIQYKIIWYKKKSCLLFPLYSVECINTKSRIWRPLWWETAD